MANKMYILRIVGIGLFILILATSSEAQDEQWLQYHSEREAQRITDSMPSSRAVSSDKPQDVKLPEFKTKQQLFFEWPTTMTKSGMIWIALDRSSEQGQWDRLFIDSNGNGHLDDEDAVTAYRTEQYRTYFGPVKIVFEGEDGPISYHLNFEFYNYNEQNRRMYIYSGGWYEGEITVAGQKKNCILLDYNVNGTFNDKSLNAKDSDKIRIGKKGSEDTSFVGNYIEIDNALYRVEIARDGAFIKLAEAKNVKFGNVRLLETITEFSAAGENGLFTRKPAKCVVSLPVGKYYISSWIIEREDQKGKMWQLQGNSFSKWSSFEVSEKTETSLEIGEPVIAGLEVQLNGDNVEFSKTLGGSLCENIRISHSGQDARDLWKMSAKNTDGSFAKTYPIPDQ